MSDIIKENQIPNHLNSLTSLKIDTLRLCIDFGFEMCKFGLLRSLAGGVFGISRCKEINLFIYGLCCKENKGKWLKFRQNFFSINLHFFEVNTLVPLYPSLTSILLTGF